MKWIYWILFKCLIREKEDFNEVKWVDEFLKRQGFVSYGFTYTKDFTVINVYKERNKFDFITIGHDMNDEHQKITSNLATNIVVAVNYYSRLR